MTAAVPDRSFYAQVVLDGRAQGDPTGGPYGHGWSTARLAGAQLVAGRGPERDGEVVLGADLGRRPGDRVSVLTATGPAEHTVTGVVAATGISPMTQRRVDWPAAYASSASSLRPAPTSAAVALAAKSIVGEQSDVLTGAARTALEPARDRQIRADAGTLLSVMAGLSAFVSIFVVASTFALGVAQRRREFGLLRTIGATPRQVRRTLFGEAFLVGTVASAAGVGLGVAVIEPFTALLQRARLIPPGLSVEVPVWALAASAGVGLLVALAAVWSASRRAGKVAPLEALREAVVEKRPMTPARWFFGLAATALGVALVWTSAAATADAAVTTAMFSAMALVLGLTLLAPVIVGPVVWLVTRPLAGLTAPTVILVREGARVAKRRVASTAAPVIATVGFTALMAGVYATLHAFDVNEEARALPSPVVVVPDGTPGLTDAVPGASTALLRTTMFATDADGGAYPLVADGIDPAVPGPLGPPTELTADTIVVEASAADDLGWRAGDDVAVAFMDGHSAQLRVATVLADELVPADVLVLRDTVRAHDPSALSGPIYVDGQTPEQVNAGLVGLGARAVPSEEYVNAVSAADWRMVRLVFTLLIGMSVGYTAIAIVNTLMMATASRRREFATLRLSGASVGQVLRVVAAEAVLVVGIGTLLGTVAALTALAGVVKGLRDYIPDTPMVLPVPVLAGVVGVCLSLGLLASLVPARLILRQPALSGFTED